MFERSGSALVSGDGADGAGGDLRCADWLPVLGDDVPLDWYEAEFAGDAEDDGAAGSVGRAEVADWDAEGVFEDGVAAGELLPDAGGGVAGEPRVSHGVVADEVSGRGDSADDLRALPDEISDEEEGSADVVVREDFEKALGDDVVRAVVVGESDFVWIAAGDKDFAEDLRLRGEGGVGAATGEEARRGESYGRRRHGGNVHCVRSSLVCRGLGFFRRRFLEESENLFLRRGLPV